MKPIPSLHLNSEYTLLNSAVKIDELIEMAITNKFESLVLTDHNVMYGTFDFVHKCLKNNIKPVIGLDLDVDDYRVVLLAKNYDGYLELVRLSSLKGKGEDISIEDINSFNLFVIDHPTKGLYVTQQRNLEVENFFIGTTTESFPNSVYMKETKTLTEDGNKTLAIMNAIENGEELDPSKFSFSPYETTLDETDSKVKQAIRIIEDCNVEFPKNMNPFPKFQIPNGLTTESYFKSVINDKAKIVLKNIENKEPYIARIKEEMKTIVELGFIDYFLVIDDLITWAKSEDILIGPGRGSAAGSLIIYILGITEVDPLQFGLLFERFLNKERISLPDVDIDIQDNKREDVVKYLFDKYGSDNVALISTFSRIGAKTALRDAARVNNFPARDINSVSKAIPMDLSLDEAQKNSVRFRAAVERTNGVNEVFNDAKLIEGYPRQRGTHAAGVVVSDNKISKKAPTIISNTELNQTQFTMDFLEENGLLKLDLLGLKNLTTIKLIVKKVFERHKKTIDLTRIPLNDKKTNALLSSGDTDGIFQFESYGMKKTLADVKVSSFDDVIAVLALYRPGPMEFIPTYIKLKEGEIKVKKISEDFDEVVKDTYGIIIYQEQIMIIAQKVAGMSFGEADILRRAISKKKLSLIQTLKSKFISGAVSKGYSDSDANDIYSMIEKFANYGFNKSHAVAYGMLSYRMAYLKTWFPIEFFTALLESSSGSQAQIKKYVDGAKSKKIVVVAPSIVTSKTTVYSKDNKIFLPLIIAKGFGDAANTKLISERDDNGPFKDFFDFVSRMISSSLGEAQITTIIESGAASAFGNTDSLLDSLSSAIRYTEMISIIKDGEKILDTKLLPKPMLSIAKKNIASEAKYETKLFGFRISSFETEGLEEEIKLVDLEYDKPKEVVVYVKGKKEFKDNNSKDMASYELVDSSAQIEAIVFEDIYKYLVNEKNKSIVKVMMKKTRYNGKDSYNIVSRWKVLKNG